MKISLPRKWQRADGSALMTAAVAAAVLGIMVVSYLAWVTNEYRLSKRSHGWSQALNLCEAGVELALAEFNTYYAYDPNNAFTSSRGWQPVGATGNRYMTVNNFKDTAGKTVGDFTVTAYNLSSKFPYVQCVSTVKASGNTPVTRTLQVVLKKRPGFRYALVSRLPMTLSSSSGLLVDSFNSSKSTESTNGRYDVAKRTPYGNIATLSSNAVAITVKGVSVYGYVFTAPGGHVAFQNGSSVGATFTGAQRTSTEATSEAAGWVAHNFIYDIPDVVVPNELASLANLGTINGNYTFNGGDYKIGDLKNTTGNITVNGNVRLYVTGNVQLTGSSQMTVKTNATLELYIAGSVNVAGNGMVNENGYAENVTWLGLSSSTSWSMGGNFDFVGTVYAPRATLALDGAADFVGAYVANQITQGSSAKVHYDEALGIATGKRGYTVMSWQPLVYRNSAWVLETN